MSSTSKPRKYTLTSNGLYLDQVLVEKPGVEDLRALALSTAPQISALLDHWFGNDSFQLQFNTGGELELAHSEVSPAAQYLNLAQRFDGSKQSLQILIAWCFLCTLANRLAPTTEPAKSFAQALFIATAKWHLSPAVDQQDPTEDESSEEVLLLPWPSSLAVFKNISATSIAQLTGCEIHLTNEGDLLAYFPTRHSMKLPADPLWSSLCRPFSTSMSRHDAVVEIPESGQLAFTVSSILGGSTVFKLNTAAATTVDLFEGLAGYEFQARHGNNPDRTTTPANGAPPATSGSSKFAGA